MSPDDLTNKIISQLKSSGSARVAQIPQNSAKAWLINILATTPLISNSGVLLVATTELDKNKLISNLNFWQQTNKKRQPIYDFNKDKNSALFNLIKQKAPIIVAAAADLETPLPRANDFMASCLQIKLSEISSPQTIIKKLTSAGYQRQVRVFLPGEIALRGEIIDIFPINDERPLRLEFKNKIIDKLYYFDPTSQKSTDQLNQVIIVPLSELTDGLTSSLNDYLPSNTVIISSSDLTLPFTDKKFYYLKWCNLINSGAIPAGFIDSPNYHHQTQQLISDLKTKKNWTIYLASRQNLPQNSTNNIINLNPLTYANGWLNQSLKLWLLTDHELGTDKVKENKNKLTPLRISELKIGDYVVHVDHGIAKFAGLSKQAIGQANREYFVLHYAQGDKLYVPIDRLDRISKYIGLSRPPLHRLSGTSWTNALIKIKKETLETARQLINTYAARQITTTKPINQIYPEENQLADDFPFTETPDQIKALNEIANDLKKSRPMDRLICGDVGFGKTEIALRTAYKIILSGGQVALLCPTTILAQQHFDNFQARLNKYGVNVALLSRFKPPNKQKQIISALAKGLIDAVIGTHRLLSNDIAFKNLQLLIIDEEQKFGVRHKERLKQLRAWVHILTLSATPIPRTLYFSLTGIKPVSLITTPPAGRRPVKTCIAKYDPNIIKKALTDEINRNGQAYYLYNQVESIAIKARQIKKLIPQAKIGIAHGQLASAQLAKVMHNFDRKKIDILVCSTIIENGLDLANVNTLIVEQAPRFGLGQLYQLRGRIGRSYRQAFAYFFYSADKLTGLALKRLQTLEAAQQLGEGFAIAKRDMEIRGIGNLLGSKQHGHVKTIGLNLYLMLLEQTVSELKTGQISALPAEVTIDLPLTYNIPDRLVKTQQEKFSLYQKLSRIKEIDRLDEFVRDNFAKALPQEFSNLINILKIKILCQQVGISSIDTIKARPGEIKIILKLKKKLTKPQLSKIAKINAAWQYKNNKLKIEKQSLGNDWINKLQKTLVALK